MKIQILSIISAIALSTAAYAETSLTILNSGSKTGSFSMASTAYYTDLLKSYDTLNLVNPGDRCVAIGNILSKIEGPILMPWASDYEADGRNGGCVTFDITQGHVIRYNAEPMRICSMSAADVTKISGKIGHTVPVDGPLSRSVNEINRSFGTEHTAISYDGQGNVRLALVNGEIDYALLTNEHANYVIENGGSCNQDLSKDPDTSLSSLDPTNPRLVFSFDNVWLGLNMTAQEAEQLKKTLIEKHNDCTSASATYTGCGNLVNIIWDLSDKQAQKRWETAVESQR